jgi:hypothetical protein
LSFAPADQRWSGRSGSLGGSVGQDAEAAAQAAPVKISSVASKLTTLSAQDMIKAMAVGQRDPLVLAGWPAPR